MTDKEQIIIDGVDVKNCKGIDLGLFPLAKCKFLKFKTSDGGIAGIWCSDHTNCYFKQLQRKEQECEKWKEKWNIGFQKFCDKDNEIQRYKQALDEIEKKCCAVLNGDEKILYAYQIKEIITKAKDGE